MVTDKEHYIVALIVGFTLCWLPSLTLAQDVKVNAENRRDSVAVQEPERFNVWQRSEAVLESPQHYGVTDPEAVGAENLSVNPLATEVKRPLPYLANWDTGVLFGNSYNLRSPFSFGNAASLSAIQQFDKLVVSGTLELSKTMTNGMGIVNGLGGRVGLDYTFNRNVSLHAFGGLSYYGFLSSGPGFTGYYYGGFFTLNTNNRKWGMDLGARSVYNPMTGRWETIPIAMPYYNLGGSKLGVDLGGIVYSLLRSAADSKNRMKPGEFEPGRGPFILVPPVDVKPKIKPVETPAWVNTSNQF